MRIGRPSVLIDKEEYSSDVKKLLMMIFFL